MAKGKTSPKRALLKTRVIGLTGNIACGKSTVARLLAETGLAVVDADQVSREITEKGQSALDAIVTEFGSKILTANQELDRRKLRDLIFNDARKRKRLEDILHPAIQKRTQELLARYFAQGKTTVIYEASLLFEAKREKDFKEMLVVTCPEAIQIRRILSRDSSMTPELALQIARAQMPQAEKATRATWVIENDATEDDLKRKVTAWILEARLP